MLFAILDKESICIGSSSKGNSGDLEYPGFTGFKWNGSEWIDPKSLNEHKSDGIIKIKSEAAQRISALDWELERVNERKIRGKKSQSDIDIVLDKRESIRVASDEAEVKLNALTTIDEVKAFSW